MTFIVETYLNDDGEKMVYLSANDGASGAAYPYETIEDIGKALARYIELYYPDT